MKRGGREHRKNAIFAFEFWAGWGKIWPRCLEEWRITHYSGSVEREKMKGGNEKTFRGQETMLEETRRKTYSAKKVEKHFA